LSDWIVSKNSAIQGKLNSIDSAIKTNLTNSNSTLKTAIAENLTNSDSPLKVLEKNFNYFKKLMRNHTHEYDINYSGGISTGWSASGSSTVVKNKKPIVVLDKQGHGGSCFKAAIKLWDEGDGNIYDKFYNHYENGFFLNDQDSDIKAASGRVCKIGDEAVLSNYYSR